MRRAIAGGAGGGGGGGGAGCSAATADEQEGSAASAGFWVVNPRLDQTRFCLYQLSNGVSRKMRSYSKRTTRGGLWPLQLGNRANDPAHCCRVPSFCFGFVSPLLKTVTCQSGLTFAALLTAHDPTRVRTFSLDVCVKKISRVGRL